MNLAKRVPHQIANPLGKAQQPQDSEDGNR